MCFEQVLQTNTFLRVIFLLKSNIKVSWEKKNEVNLFYRHLKVYKKNTPA